MIKLIPFDLKSAIRGSPLVTRDGREVLKFAYCADAADSQKIAACIESKCKRFAVWYVYYKTGKNGYQDSIADLFMKTT